MSQTELPGTDAARYEPGDRLLALTAAHDAFRRDLNRLARLSTPVNLGDPHRRTQITRGWVLFRQMLELHHGAEDRHVFPRLRSRLAGSDAAQSVLDAMDTEHALLDPLVAAVDEAFAQPSGDPGAVLDELAVRLCAHMSHEEREAMPLVRTALTGREWRAAVGDIHRMVKTVGDLTDADFLPWLTDGTTPQQEKVIVTIVPAPIRLLYRRSWKPGYHRAKRW